MTAAHVIEGLLLGQKHANEMAAYESALNLIEGDQSLSPKQRRKKAGELGKNPKWIKRQAILWGGWKTTVKDIVIDPDADIATGKLDPFLPQWTCEEFAVFKDPSEEMPTGTSLCRLGFPFANIQAKFNEPTGQFDLEPGCLPIPRFPNDGIHTRMVVRKAKERSALFVETSTPGLKGQSGGPIFDRFGHVWAIQSCTQHLPLGFTPSVVVNGKQIVEHQFMHVGWGSHVREVIGLLDAHGIKYTTSKSAQVDNPEK